MAYQQDRNSDGDIIQPSALVLENCADIAATINNEQGYLTYCTLASKLGFITASGVSGELVTSA